jgi:hypothetical protein
LGTGTRGNTGLIAIRSLPRILLWLNGLKRQWAWISWGNAKTTTMKKLIVIVLLLSVQAFYAEAQDTLRIQQNGVEKEDENLQEIDIRELPEIIKV